MYRDMTQLTGMKVWIFISSMFFIAEHEFVFQISVLRHNFEKNDVEQAKKYDFEDFRDIDNFYRNLINISQKYELSALEYV